MILNKIFKLVVNLSIIMLINSCGTIKEYVGLSDEDVERELINSTPELVLPPDFGKKAIKSGITNKENDFAGQSPMAFIPNQQTVQPRVSNFIAPNFYPPSSKTPSDSLEKFKQNRRFTIGEWVYGEYVQGIKKETYIINLSTTKVIIFQEDTYQIKILIHLEHRCSNLLDILPQNL